MIERELMVAPAVTRSVGKDAFWPDLWESLRSPEFWALSSWLGILSRARKSRFGLFWLLAPSIIYVYGLGSFFSSLQGRPLSQFAAHIALGAMVFRTVLSAVVGSAGVYNANASFIMDGHMRLTDYVLQALAKAFFDMCMYMPVLLVALWLYGHASLVGLLLLPISTFIVYLNALWMSVLISLAGTRFPDVGQLIGNTSIFLFLLTPIVWYPADMPAGSMRGQLMRLNPFFHFLEITRAPALGEPMETTSLYYVAVLTVAGLALAALLYRRYSRYVPIWI
jgi:ABC-type polysaccharide/polyol phosphate export permease